MSGWRVLFAATARRSLGRFPEKVAAAVIEFSFGPLADNPARVGKRLSRELADYYSARRGGYRVIYRIDEDDHSVLVVRVDHRRDAYRPQ